MDDARLYNDIFQRLQRRVYSYEGTIRQFLVDDKGMVLIACYGIVAHENDAERATRCAMGIANDLLAIGIGSSAGVTTVSEGRRGKEFVLGVAKVGVAAAMTVWSEI